MKKISVFKLLALTLAAVFTLCSCAAVKDAASEIANAAINSARSEISGAISEGMAELSEGMNDFSEGMAELTSALSEASDDIRSAKEEISEQYGSAMESAYEEIKSDISDAMPNISSAIADITTPAETDMTADTTTEPPVSDDTEEKEWYTFRNKTRYDEHYEKHGAEFGSITKEEYLQLANDLIHSDSDRVLHKYSEDGDYMYFDQDTGYFLVLSEDGYIRTFFIPTAGINYWNRQ